MQESIEFKLREKFGAAPIEVTNESHNHSVPKNSETHFKVLIVSPLFEGKSRIDRQRMVNETLDIELKSGLHALTQKTMTPEEYKAWTGKFESPDCHGGSKKGKS
jgi:BolA protein